MRRWLAAMVVGLAALVGVRAQADLGTGNCLFGNPNVCTGTGGGGGASNLGSLNGGTAPSGQVYNYSNGTVQGITLGVAGNPNSLGTSGKNGDLVWDNTSSVSTCGFWRNTGGSTTWAYQACNQSGTGDPAGVTACYSIGDTYSQTSTKPDGKTVTWVATTAGAAGTCVWHKINGSLVYAEDYQNVGGVASTTGGVQEAITGCGTTGSPARIGHCTIMLPPGNTNITSQIFVGSNTDTTKALFGIDIIGYGSGLQAQTLGTGNSLAGSSLTYTGTALAAGQGVFEVSQAEDSYFGHFSINAGSAADYALVIRSCGACGTGILATIRNHFEDMWISHANQSMIAFLGTTGPSYLDQMDTNTFTSIYMAGYDTTPRCVYMQDTNTQNTNFYGGWCDHPLTYGFDIEIGSVQIDGMTINGTHTPGATALIYLPDGTSNRCASVISLTRSTLEWKYGKGIYAPSTGSCKNGITNIANNVFAVDSGGDNPIDAVNYQHGGQFSFKGNQIGTPSGGVNVNYTVQPSASLSGLPVVYDESGDFYASAVTKTLDFTKLTSAAFASRDPLTATERFAFCRDGTFPGGSYDATSNTYGFTCANYLGWNTTGTAASGIANASSVITCTGGPANGTAPAPDHSCLKSGNKALVNVVQTAMPAEYQTRRGGHVTFPILAGSTGGSAYLQRGCGFAQSITTTGTLTSGATTLGSVNATTLGLTTGMFVSGQGIAPMSRITVSGSTATLSANATVSGSVTLVFGTFNTCPNIPGMGFVFRKLQQYGGVQFEFEGTQTDPPETAGWEGAGVVYDTGSESTSTGGATVWQDAEFINLDGGAGTAGLAFATQQAQMTGLWPDVQPCTPNSTTDITCSISASVQNNLTQGSQAYPMSDWGRKTTLLADAGPPALFTTTPGSYDNSVSNTGMCRQKPTVICTVASGAPVITTATLTLAGSLNVTGLTSNSTMAVGSYVIGNGIVPGTTITNCTGSGGTGTCSTTTSVALSNKTQPNLTSTTLTIWPVNGTARASTTTGTCNFNGTDFGPCVGFGDMLAMDLLENKDDWMALTAPKVINDITQVYDSQNGSVEGTEGHVRAVAGPPRTGTFSGSDKHVTGLPYTSDLWIGMTATGTGIAANSTISTIDSSSQVTLASSGNPTAGTVTVTFGVSNSTGKQVYFGEKVTVNDNGFYNQSRWPFLTPIVRFAGNTNAYQLSEPRMQNGDCSWVGGFIQPSSWHGRDDNHDGSSEGEDCINGRPITASGTDELGCDTGEALADMAGHGGGFCSVAVVYPSHNPGLTSNMDGSSWSFNTKYWDLTVNKLRRGTGIDDDKYDVRRVTFNNCYPDAAPNSQTDGVINFYGSNTTVEDLTINECQGDYLITNSMGTRGDLLTRALVKSVSVGHAIVKLQGTHGFTIEKSKFIDYAGGPPVSIVYYDTGGAATNDSINLNDNESEGGLNGYTANIAGEAAVQITSFGDTVGTTGFVQNVNVRGWRHKTAIANPCLFYLDDETTGAGANCLTGTAPNHICTDRTTWNFVDSSIDGETATAKGMCIVKFTTDENSSNSVDPLVQRYQPTAKNLRVNGVANQDEDPSKYTFATLPTCGNSNRGQLAWISDSSAASTCTAGSGTARACCVCTGATPAWGSCP